MLTPSSHQIVLLPQDRELIETLGITEAEYRTFLKQCIKCSRIEPGKPVNFLVIPFLIQLAIGLALTYLAGLLFRPKTPGRAAEIRQNSLPGQNVVGRSEYAPKAGFDSLQNVVELGSTIPLVYTKREVIDGVTYGGVRVNTNLLWSQMISQGGSQMLRAVFLIAEGTIGEVDPAQFAFGDNVLGGYDLADANATSSRATFYVSPEGGRLTSADRVAGRTAANDPGNAENDGGTDVFQIRGINNEWTSDFCYAAKPSTQTQFGVYSLIGNGLAFRINPQLRPAVIVKTEPAGKTDTRILCNSDGVATAQRNKYNTLFSSRSGVTQRNGSTTSGSVNLAVGDTLTYVLSSTSDANTVFIGTQEGPDHQETCRDVAQTVSGRQRSWDDALSVGDLYKFGSALVVCETRTPDGEIFISEVDQEPIGGGQSMTVTFRVVRAGTAVLNPISATTTATNSSHIYKVAVASFAAPRSAQVIEIGLRSTLGIRISGLCNFRDSLSQSEIDGRACTYYNGRTYRPDQSLELSTYQSGSYSGSEIRYSFFKIGYRIAGSDSEYTYLDQCFGTRSITQQSVYNFLRLQMPSVQRWEFRLEPLSGWEIRNNIATGTLEVLDARIGGYKTVSSVSGSDVVTISYSGEPVARSADTFSLAATRNKNLGVALTDTNDYADDWGKLAESFVFEEIQSSARSPEHEVVYCNVLTPNPNIPNYDDIALVGINLRSSTEFSQLNQLSVYVNEGIGGIHTFPQVFQDLLTNSRYGVGSILSAEQIDVESFTESTQWTRDRRYFFDGALDRPINLRQWGSQTAGYFLLDLVIRNGRFALQPAVYFDRPEPITNLYTSGNILEDSFEFVYAESDQRIPNRVSVKWRQEKASNDDSSRGLFPVIREVTVREVGTPVDAPLEAIDLSDFCTSELHAIDVAKYICRGRRLITHSVRFKTTPDQAGLGVGRCFKLGLETIAYLQPNNGAIDANGKITTIEPLADGTYTVLLWRGMNADQIQEVELVVKDQSTAQYRNAVFCLKQASTETRAYKVQSLGFDEDGNIQVEALYFPLTENGYSAIVDGWDVASNWSIEGRIGTSENTEETDTPFTGVSIVGPGTATVGVASTFTALVSGGSGSYSYSWSGTGVTFNTTTSATVSVTATTSGAKTITCFVTKDGVTQSATKIFTAIAPTTTGTIGTVTITGDTTATVNVAKSYSASFSGTVSASNCFYSWSTSPSTASIVNSGTATASITFEVAGTYTVSCRISSPVASDSPVTQTRTVTVS